MNMDRKQTLGLLYQLRAAWPSFAIESDTVFEGIKAPGTIETWFDSLKEFSFEEVKTAFKQIRSTGAKHAPNVSEFESQLRLNRIEANQKERAEQFRLNHTCSDDPGHKMVARDVGEGRKMVYFEMTDLGASTYEAKMQRNGLRKRPITFGNGRRGFTWERFEDEPASE